MSFSIDVRKAECCISYLPAIECLLMAIRHRNDGEFVRFYLQIVSNMAEGDSYGCKTYFLISLEGILYLLQLVSEICCHLSNRQTASPITFTYFIVDEFNWVHFEHTVWINFEILTFCCLEWCHKYANNLETILIPHPQPSVRTASDFVKNQSTEKIENHCEISFVYFERYSKRLVFNRFFLS